MNIYTELPSELRGANLEAHSGWPRQWTTDSVNKAMQTRIALQHVIDLSGIHFAIDVITHDNGTTIIVDRPTSSDRPDSAVR